jgi:hypothetical protein
MTKNVVNFQNYSSACGFCACHMKKTANTNAPVPDHQCPKNYTGSSKGMEAKAALDCVNQVGSSHADIEGFVSMICLDDGASTRAYLQHSFANLDDKNLPHLKNKKGETKTGKRNNKGKLGKDHPIIQFLADLSHRVRTFAKYVYALKNTTIGQSEMNDIDCLRLKCNYA